MNDDDKSRNSYRKVSDGERERRIRDFEKWLISDDASGRGEKADAHTSAKADLAASDETAASAVTQADVDRSVPFITFGATTSGVKNIGSGKTEKERGADGVKSGKANIHKGHRQRLRQSIRRDSELNGFSDVEILETLLSFAVPRKDTNPIAHALIDRFGSLLDIMRAPKSELKKVRSMTDRAAELIPMLPIIGLWNDKREISIDSHARALNFFGSIFAGGTVGAYAAYLDGAFDLIAIEKHDSIVMPPREIVGSAYKFRAKYVMMSCNDDVFSYRYEIAQNIAATYNALSAIGVQLLDCLMFSDYGYYTLDGCYSDDGFAEFVFVPLQRASDSPELICKLLTDDI